MNPVILVGRRSDGGHRDRLWAWCKARWEVELGWPIYEGHHGTYGDPEPFCLSVASNRAYVSACGGDLSPRGRWDVAVYVGADWLAGNTAQVVVAASDALERGLLVFAHDQTLVLTEDATIAMLASPPGSPLPEQPPAGFPSPYEDPFVGVWHRNTFSGVLAVPRTLWEDVGGFDERFVGWGWDDLAFWAACSALAGYDRIPGTIAHLWHPTSWDERENAPTHGPNQVLGERYLAAKGNETLMRAILAERA